MEYDAWLESNNLRPIDDVVQKVFSPQARAARAAEQRARRGALDFRGKRQDRREATAHGHAVHQHITQRGAQWNADIDSGKINAKRLIAQGKIDDVMYDYMMRDAPKRSEGAERHFSRNSRNQLHGQLADRGFFGPRR